MRQWMAAALAVCLILSGCADREAPAAAVGLYEQASGIAPETVLLTVDGWAVPAGRYFYWLTADCDYIAAQYAETGRSPDWAADVGGQSLDAYVKEQALSTTVLYATIEAWAERYGCVLTAADLAAIQADWDAQAEACGGETAYLAVLADMGLDRAGAQLFSADYYLYEHLRTLSRTAGSPLYPAEGTLEAYERESGILTADILWFPTAAAAWTARAVLAGDAAAELEPLAATGGGSYRRQTFLPEDETLPSQVRTAAAALARGELSSPVETGDGAWLLRRRTVDRDMLLDAWFDQKLQTAAEQAEIEAAPAYNAFTAASFYQGLTQARHEYEPEKPED